MSTMSVSYTHLDGHLVAFFAAFDEMRLLTGAPVGDMGDPVSYTHLDVYKRQALRATVRAQKAAAEQAAETYRKTLITAGSEVEDALIAYGNYTSQMQYLHKENNANSCLLYTSRCV